jgi:prolyl oligopeptidase
MSIARIPWHLAAAALVALAPALAIAQAKPPAPPVRNVTDTYFGVAVPDPYRYFENLKDPEVAGWMKAEADYTKAVLQKIPGRDTLYKEIEERGNAASARVTSVQIVGSRVYYQKRLATENLFKLYTRDGFAGKERMLVDPEAIRSKDGEHYALDYYAPSPDNRYVAYGISPAGSEDSVLRVLDLATGKETGDVIDRAQFGSPSWLPDGRLVYTRLIKLPADMPAAEKYQNQRVYIHKLGDSPDADIPLFGTGVSQDVTLDPVEFVSAFNPLGSSYMLAMAINGVQREFKLWVAPLAAVAGGKTPWVKVFDNADEVTDIAVHGDDLYLMSHKGAPRYKVLRTSLAKPDLPSAELVVAPGEAVVNAIGAAKDALYLRKMNGGNSELFRLDYGKSAQPKPIALPYVGDIDRIALDVRVPGIVFDFGGWTRFGSYYVYQPASGKVVDTGLQPQGRYDNPGTLVATEVRARAADGTMIPLSIVYRKGTRLDGSNPTILYGYGSYGIPETPFFRPTWLPWFDRGGVLAVAHVRGGGEYGDDWYKGGYKATKANTWRDAIACAEWLIENKYTSPSKLAINGGSAGGLFVGGAITERPDLFGAAVDQVPFSDTIRSEVSASGPANAPEFGTIKTEEGFRALLNMSPYLAVKDGVKYPAVMLTTGVNDPRVDAWDVAKMAARLMAATTSGKPILLRVEYDEGHGMGATKKTQYEERADVFAFLLWQAGVKGFQP